MHIPWEDVEIFLTVAEEQSFSGAARRMSLTQPTISRRIGALEQRLERALFRRDVEGAHLTEEGAKLKPAALEMARFAKELEQVAGSFDDRPAGVVRCAVPPGTAYEVMVPFAKQMKKTHPEVELHIISGVDYLDLSRGHAELAIRAKAPSQPDLEMLAHVRLKMGVFASKSYVKKLGCADKKMKPKDLDWISWAYPNEHVEPTPTLKKIISDFRPVFAANDYNVQCRALAEGLGVMILPKARFSHAPYEPFVQVDVDLPLPYADAYLVCAKTMRWVPRVRAVVSELIETLTEIEGVELVED
jgi:DNA-binding transcriptional LysR family regulator